MSNAILEPLKRKVHDVCFKIWLYLELRHSTVSKVRSFADFLAYFSFPYRSARIKETSLESVVKFEIFKVYVQRAR